jgi:hypothetical protein
MLRSLFALPHFADLQSRLGRIWGLASVSFERRGQIIGPMMGPTFIPLGNVSQELKVSFPRLDFETPDYHFSLAENLREIIQSALPPTGDSSRGAFNPASGVKRLSVSFHDQTSTKGDISWDPDALFAIVSIHSLSASPLRNTGH